MCPNRAGQVKLVILEIDFIVYLYVILQAWTISKFAGIEWSFIILTGPLQF
jgi:hypothetical protein